MIQSCRLEAMLAAESCHRCGRCYRNRSSCRPPCCGNYMVTVGRRRPQLDLNRMIRVLVCMAVSQFFYFFFFSSTSRQANQVISGANNNNTNITNFIQPLNIPLIKM